MNKKIIIVDYSVQVINCIYKYGVFFLLTAKDHLSFNKALKNAYKKNQMLCHSEHYGH